MFIQVENNANHQMILASVLKKLSSELFTSEALPDCFAETPAPEDQNVYTMYLNTSIAQLKKDQESLHDGAQKQIEILQEKVQTLELENAAGFATADLQQKEHSGEEDSQISSLQMSLQEVTTTLQQQEQQTATLLEEIEDLKEQNNDLEMYNGAYQREVEQLKQQLSNVSGDDTNLKNVTEELQKVNEMLERQNAELKILQRENAELNVEKLNLEESLKGMKLQPQQNETTRASSPSESSGGGVKFGVLKRKIKDLEESNLKLQTEVTALKQQSSPSPSLTDDKLSGETNEQKQEIEDLKEQISDLQNYNSAYQREVEQLKQQLKQQLSNASGDDTNLKNVTEELQKVNEILELRNAELESLQKENSELNSDKQKLEELRNQQLQQQQNTETASNSSSESSGGSVKFGVLKRQIKELEENNLKLQTEVTALKQQSSPSSSLTDDKLSGETNELKQEIEDLKEQTNDLQNYNSAYQLEVEQLKQQLQESSAAGSHQVELQESVNNLNQQLQQYQTYCTNMQAENEHLKRLSQAAVSQGPDQEVGIKMELQNQIATLTNENHHYQTEYENLRQSWIKYQQESATYMESLQQQNQQLQLEYQQLQQQQKQQSVSFNSQPTSIEPTSAPPANSNQLQEKLHDLSLMLTEKTEECARLQQENDNTKAKLVEVQNDSSDMELVREECKQLKAMLMSKGDEEIISNLQMENKRLKQEMDHVQKLDMEKDNDLSDMELLREECRQLKLMLVNKDSPAEFQQLEKEKTQLEHSLRSKDDELSNLNASLIDMQNSVSDMDLVREECKQLKTMLMNSTNQTQEQPASLQSDYSDNSYKELEAKLKTREDELRHKDSIIYEMQNTSGDVELLRQQCEQLKGMLSERENSGVGANNTFNESSVNQNNTSAFDNSFMVQVQQLEEVMKEKDQVISEKELQLKQYLNRITELENSCSDMELLHNECRALKEMIGEKETMFAELQNDLDLANSIVEQRHNETSVKNTENHLLREQIKELSECIASKDVEISNMRDEMQEAMLQDENIHMLQTEYRNVEEQLKGKEKELADTQQSLFEIETHYERMKVYEEQYQTLKDTLKEKDAELSTLQLQSSDSSILESETVTLLQQELNQLKSLLYEKENEIVERNNVLERKNVELQDLSNSLNEIKMSLDELKKEKDEIHRQLEQAKTDADKVQNQQQQKTEIVTSNSPSESTSNVGGGVKFGVLKRKIKELEETNLKLQQQQQQQQQTNVDNNTGEMESQVIYYKSMVEEVNGKYYQLKEKFNNAETKCDALTKERDELQLLKEGLEDEYKAAADVQNIQIEQLQRNMVQNEEHQQALIERLTAQSSENTNSVEGLQQEKHIVDVFVSNMNGLLQISSVSQDRTTELMVIMQQVQVLLNTLQQREALLQRMQEDHQSQLERLLFILPLPLLIVLVSSCTVQSCLVVPQITAQS